MSFTFSGIFARGERAVLDALGAEFGGVGKVVEDPFRGIALSRLPAAVAFGPGRNPQAEELARRVIAFSCRFAKLRFVYVYAECGAGACEYAGFVAQAGQRIHDEPFRDNVGDVKPLRRLLLSIGVRIGERGYFAPLGRTFFEPPKETVGRS